MDLSHVLICINVCTGTTSLYIWHVCMYACMYVCMYVHLQVSQDGAFQDSITRTMGEFAGVLPDYHKPDIMNLINSYMPLGVPGETLQPQHPQKESER